MSTDRPALSSAEIAARKGWQCCQGCGNTNGVYPPPKRSNHPPLCPTCHEAWVRSWTRERFIFSRTTKAWDTEGAHGVDYTEMRTGFQKKNISEEEKKTTKKLLRKLNKKSLDMLLSEVRYMKQKMRNERRLAAAKTQHWEEAFGG